MRPTVRFLLMSRIVACAVAFVMVTGCGSGGVRPFSLAAICLEDPQDVSDFIEELRAEANRSHMKFLDSSVEVAEQGRALGSQRPGDFVFMVGLDHADGYSLSVSDLRSGYQVGIGFNGDHDSRDAPETRAWAAEVLARLASRWRVEEVQDPEMSGIFPMQDCGAPQS